MVCSFLSQMTCGALVIWTAGVFPGSDRWKVRTRVSRLQRCYREGKSTLVEFGHLWVQPSFYSFSFHLSIADRLSGRDETWVHHALCGLEAFFLLTCDGWCACVAILTCCFTAWPFFSFMMVTYLRAHPRTSIYFFIWCICILTKQFKADNVGNG